MLSLWGIYHPNLGTQTLEKKSKNFKNFETLTETYFRRYKKVDFFSILFFRTLRETEDLDSLFLELKWITISMDKIKN